MSNGVTRSPVSAQLKSKKTLDPHPAARVGQLPLNRFPQIANEFQLPFMVCILTTLCQSVRATQVPLSDSFLGNVTNNSIPQVLSPSPGQDLFGTKEPDFMVLLGLSVLGVPFAIKLLDILADRFLNSQSDVRDLQANLKQFPKSQAFFLNQFIQEFSEQRFKYRHVVKALLNVNLAMLRSYFSKN